MDPISSGRMDFTQRSNRMLGIRGRIWNENVRFL